MPTRRVGSTSFVDVDNGDGMNDSRLRDEEPTWDLKSDARPLLPKAAFFLGDLRDGLPMLTISTLQLNMQAAFLISAKNFTEKQVGLLFLVFGLSQFLCMAPAGYFLDYSNRKIHWVITSGILTSIITVVCAIMAPSDGSHLGYLIPLYAIQGGITAVIPPGFNGITLGIVGSTGFTHQVSRNRMMNHVGTALVVATGSLIAYFLYPNIGALFTVSPLAALGVWYHLHLIMPSHVDRDAARALIYESPTMTEYELADDVAMCKQKAVDVDWVANESEGETSDVESAEDSRYQSMVPPPRPKPPPSNVAGPRNYRPEPSPVVGTSMDSSGYRPPDLVADGLQPLSGEDQAPRNDDPVEDPRKAQSKASQPSDVLRSDSGRRSFSSIPSFRFHRSSSSSLQNDKSLHASSPLAVLGHPTLMVFVVVIFFFHLANSSVLPLVMQSLALRDVQAGILLSGLCILIAQGFMSFLAKICGDYSPIWGRKGLFLVGLVSLPLRCFLLTILVTNEQEAQSEKSAHVLKALVLATQLLDSVGAGIVGTMQILVTSDISGGTGRFSLLMGVTTAAMCLGATVSGYLGQALAQDYGYPFAFTALGAISLIPFTTYTLCMPETLPESARPRYPKKRRRRLRELLRNLNESRRRIFGRNHRPPVEVDVASPVAQGRVELV